MSHFILASPLLPLHQRIRHREPWYNAFLQKGVMCKDIFNDTSKFSSHKYRKQGRLINKEKRKEGRKSCLCLLLITIFNPSRLEFYGFCPNEAIHKVSVTEFMIVRTNKCYVLDQTNRAAPEKDSPFTHLVQFHFVLSACTLICTLVRWLLGTSELTC